MKDTLRKVFSPVLNLFEQGEGEFAYKESNRSILKIVGGLFIMLSLFSLAVALFAAQWAALFPILVFFSAGAVCEIVGFLGSDKAVAKIWRNR